MYDREESESERQERETKELMEAPASVNVIELLKCCLFAAVCSQRYVLNDLLKIREVLSAMHAEETNGKHPLANEPSPDNPRSGSTSSMSSDDSDDADSEFMSRSSAMMLSKEQQRRLTISINTNLGVESKGELAHRASSTTDLVTSADKLVQQVVIAFLHRTFGSIPPFTIVGEEEGDHTTEEETAAIETCWSRYQEEAKALNNIPCFSALDAHAADRWGEADYFLQTATAEELRRRVAVFIDPIDGTNAFVEGELQVPMTLIGIAVDGVPVAGVVNKIFLTNADGSMQPASLSYCCTSLQSATNMVRPFVVVSGNLVPSQDCRQTLPGGFTSTTPLSVTFSSTTRADIREPPLQRLAPVVRRPARGAGYKCMMVVECILQQMELRSANQNQPQDNSDCEFAEVFVTANDAIKKWDSCAPHAILRALGGCASNMEGVPIRYDLAFHDSHFSKKSSVTLKTGFVATISPAVMQVVSNRLDWQEVKHSLTLGK